MAGLPATAATAAGTPTPAVEECGTGPALTRPASLILTCADEGERAARLHWVSWTGTRATATGIVTWRACAGECAYGTRWDTAEADFTLIDPVRASATRVLFTRLDLHVTGATPPGFMRDVEFSVAPIAASEAIPPTRVQAGKSGVRSGSARASASSGTLGYAQIEGYWDLAGGPTTSISVPGYGTYSRDQVAAAITGAESSFYPGIIQPGVDYCGSGADKAGWGLWQITCGDSVPQYGVDFQVLDPWNNAEAAVSKYDAADGFSPWATYTSGAYHSFLQTTSADTALTDPGQYIQVNSTPNGTPSTSVPDPGSTYGPLIPGTTSAPAAPTITGLSGVVHGTVNLTATDSDSSVTSVRFYIDGVSAGTATKSGTTFTLAWNSADVSDGPHAVTAVATNSAGSTTSAAATVTVENLPTGSPAIYDPATGNYEVFATAGSGALSQTAYVPDSGWSSWNTIGGDIAGTPAAIYDPVTGNTEVYATAASGALAEIAYVPGSGWSSWKSLGGSITGSPAVAYDPVTKNLEVYATAASGALAEIAYVPGSGWSSWKSLGGSITGSPAAVYDKVTGNLDVYATAASGALAQISYSASSGWSSWKSLGGLIAGSPAAVYDTATGNFEVYATAASGALAEIAYSSASGWSSWKSLGGSITGSPSAVNDTATGNFEVYATAASGAVSEIAYVPGSGWSSWQDLGGSVTGSPVAVNDPLTGNLEVYAVATSGALSQIAFSTKSGWSGWKDLGGSLSSL